MGWRPKNLNDSLTPFNTLLAIMGYSVFQYPIGRPRVLFSVFYAIIVTSIFWILFAFTIKYSFESTWFGRQEKIVYYIIYFNFVIATLAQILNSYYNKRFLGLIHRIILVDETLHEFGATFDYTKCMNFGIRLVVYWLMIVGFQNFIDVLWFLNRLPFSEIIILVSVLHHPIHINSMVSLNFSLMVGLIETRFSKANKLLEDTIKPINQRSMNDYSWRFFYNKVNEIDSKVSSGRTLKIYGNRKNLIQTIKHAHLELTLIAKDLDHFYGVIILLEMAAFFVMFTGFFYTLYDITVLDTSGDRKLMKIIVIMTFVVVYLLKLMVINYTCERITAEAKRTGSLIHCTYNCSDDSDDPDEIRQFALQLMNNPLSFSPVGFFTLGYNFLRGFFGSVVTYLVILIQMDTNPQS